MTRQIADRYLAARAEFDPEAADALGVPAHLLIPSLSPDAFARRRELDAATLATLTASGATDPLALAMSERLSAGIALYDSGFTTSLVAPLATPVHRLRQVFDDLPRRTEQDWERVADHLDAAALGYEQYARTLLDSAQRGHRIAARQVHGLAKAVRDWFDPEGTDFYRSLVAEHSGSATLQARLLAAADTATDAAMTFAGFLTTELSPLATQADGVGEDLYAVTSSAFLGIQVDLDELYAYGWQELSRIGEQAGRLAGRLAGASNLSMARAALDSHPSGRIRVGDELIRWLQDRLDRTTKVLQGKHFDIPDETAPVQARMVTAGSGVMYYAPADRAGTRPARVWWSVSPGISTISTWRAVSTVHHEGLPGHHLQYAITAGLSDLHPWQRYLCHVHGYAEGWAHYAEQLAVDIGLVQDDAEHLGVLDAQLWRAARIVIDLGLHTDRPIPVGNDWTRSRRWTPELAAQLLSEIAGTDRATAAFEVDRYLGWPGQALSFKVGARLIEQIRDDRKQRPGYDPKQFHASLLGAGPMGLEPLRRTLLGQAAGDPRSGQDEPARNAPAVEHDHD